MLNKTTTARIRAALSNPGWVCLAWFGMTAGISLLAVPAQFGASAATRAVSLDVARTIFTAMNKAELVALVLLLIVVRVSGNARLLRSSSCCKLCGCCPNWPSARG